MFPPEGALASEPCALMSELKILIHTGNHLNVVKPPGGVRLLMFDLVVSR